MIMTNFVTGIYLVLFYCMCSSADESVMQVSDADIQVFADSCISSKCAENCLAQVGLTSQLNATLGSKVDNYDILCAKIKHLELSF